MPMTRVRHTAGMSRVPALVRAGPVILQHGIRREHSPAEAAKGMPARVIHRGVDYSVARDANNARKRRERMSFLAKVRGLLS